MIDINVSSDDFIYRTLEFIRLYAGIKNELYIRKLTDMLLSYIFETIDEPYATLPTEMKKYIDINFISIFHQNDLSKHFNYSTSHLAKIFKENFNLTPKQYAKQLLLKEITNLLYNNMSVADISEKLNFSSPENLSRFFKNNYGYPPSEYKKHFKDLTV